MLEFLFSRTYLYMIFFLLNFFCRTLYWQVPNSTPPPPQKPNGPSLSSVLATTGDRSAAAGYTRV